MNLLQEELGKKLSVSEVAKFLGVAPTTVTKYYDKLGGIVLGGRRKKYIFFERRLIDAISKQSEGDLRDSSVGCPGEDKREEIQPSVQNKSRGENVGGRKKEDRKLIGDPHGLLV